MADARDTPFGHLRRTGPATAELFDKNTGIVYGFNFAAMADQVPLFNGQPISMEDGREICDRWFSDKGGSS